MNSRSFVGIALVVLDILALAYQGFTYHAPRKAVEVGPIRVTKDEKHTVRLPPVLGALALVGGIAVLVLGRTEK